MVSVIIYVLLLGLNILAYYKKTDKPSWFNLLVIVFMIEMAFVIK